MISAQSLVSTLLEEIRRDFVAAFGPYFRNGLFAHGMEQLYGDLVELNPGQFKNVPVEEAIDMLINQGNTFVVAGGGQIRVLSNSPELELSKEFVDVLEKQMGLSQYPQVGYAAHYQSSVVNYPTQNLFDVRSKTHDIEFDPDIAGVGEQLEKKIGDAKFAHQIEQWPRYTAADLSQHYTKILGQPISPEDMELLAKRFEKVLKRPARRRYMTPPPRVEI